jgi:hypothetical protein
MRSLKIFNGWRSVKKTWLVGNCVESFEDAREVDRRLRRPILLPGIAVQFSSP